ncbi:heme biosynthesis protein HemY [Tropicibacter naphthalenivorans]|uniref:Tetratricopeptide repeat protein n=1 Tax=Tropicibacter naphthalenivorans TaxID=441103 RepID=A0A0P1GD90_9RHOB|nr:heme biosynthesis HemY N-terminal domain-containing protein [Tropicibacter naphthalenivorans]CUH79494.1 tetratricopeptide repeat protein [Tropicibacter naphthalenivorans]SMC73142.1 HemY protein [Tropicibacter naphthalenivorans]
MLWSLIKIVVFVALVAALTLGAGYLMESSGGLTIQAAGMEFTLGPLQSVIAAMVLILVVWLFLKLFALVIATLKFINGDETALSRYFDRNREQKGYKALSEGMMALASGEGRLAIAKAQKAEKYLHKPELTDLLTAQAAEASGDRKKAEEVYKRLLKRDDTRFVGVRGLMHQKLEAGDTDTALQLAERAFAIKPKHGEVQDTLLRLQAEKHQWDGARKTLATKLKTGTLPRDVYRRRDAVLALSAAAEISDNEASQAAADAAIEANRNSPDLVPAAAMAARAYIARDRKRNAMRVIKKAWEVSPHPDLAAAFAEIEPNETPDQRIKRFVPLTRINPDHRETKLLKAELNLAAEDFPEARRSLGDLIEDNPDARVLAIMAAIEKGEGASDTVIRGWLARALTAPRGPQWVCEKCGTIHAQWAPLCTNCSAFDTLSWKSPPQSEVVLPAGADMLPLIVGAIEDKSEEPAPEADIIVPAEEPAAEPPVAEDAVVVEDAETVEEAKK